MKVFIVIFALYIAVGMLFAYGILRHKEDSLAAKMAAFGIIALFWMYIVVKAYLDAIAATKREDNEDTRTEDKEPDPGDLQAKRQRNRPIQGS